MSKHMLFFIVLCLHLAGCKKNREAETPPEALTGHWVCCKVYQHVAHYVNPYPNLNSNYTQKLVPDKNYVLDIGHNGIITMLVDGSARMREDFFTDLLETDLYRLTYYGSRKSKSADYFDARVAGDTMIVEGFFPYAAKSVFLGGGHGGANDYYSYTNFFVRQ